MEETKRESGNQGATGVSGREMEGQNAQRGGKSLGQSAGQSSEATSQENRGPSRPELAGREAGEQSKGTEFGEAEGR